MNTHTVGDAGLLVLQLLYLHLEHVYDRLVPLDRGLQLPESLLLLAGIPLLRRLLLMHFTLKVYLEGTA